MTFKPAVKFFIKLLSLFCLGLQLSSCTDFLKGKPKVEAFIEAKNDSLVCLKELPSKVRSVIKSESNTQQINESFNCLDKVLNEFQNRAQGANDINSFSKDDLFIIFDKFLNEAQISKQATSDLLRLKTALVGGSELRLTKAEITELRAFLGALRTEVIALMPYLKVFSLQKGQKEFSKTYLSEAFMQLSMSLKKMISMSVVIRSDYRFEDLKNLITNLNLLSDDQNDLIDLAEDIKNLLTGNEMLLSENDFKTFINSFVEILRLYSVSQQGYVSFSITNQSEMADIIEFTEGWISVLENSNQFKKTQMISPESLDPLIIKVTGKDILPVKVKAETLVQFYKALIVRVFESGPSGSVNTFMGLRKIHFANLRKEIALFKMYVAMINTMKFPEVSPNNTNGGLDISDVQKQVENVPAAVIASAIKDFSVEDQTYLVNAFNELRKEFLEKRPVVYRYKKMVMAANQEIWKQNWNDLTQALYAKMMARELLIGWGNGSDSRLVQEAEITENGLIKWYAEFKQFGIEVKLFDPRTGNAGSKSFKEANLFTYSGNGDDKLTFQESIQYLNILVSAGGTTFSELKNGYAKAGCNLNEKDVFGNPWNQEVCVYEDFKKNYKYYFNNLSYLVAYLGKLNDKQFYQFYDGLMDVARTDKVNKGNRLESADIRNFGVLLHYMESLYAQFDTDRNWNLSANEIRAGYPRFKGFATDFALKTAKDKLDLFNSTAVQALGYSCYSQDDLIKESFIYLVFNGRTPGISDLNIAPCVGKRALIDNEGEVSRSDIINTFKILKDVIGS